MKPCTKCKVSEEIAAGIFKDASWEDIPCSSCKASDLTPGGMLIPTPIRGELKTQISLQWETKEVVEQAGQQWETEIADEAPQDARDLISTLLESSNAIDMFDKLSEAAQSPKPVKDCGKKKLALMLMEVEPATLFLILSRMVGKQREAVKSSGLTHAAAHWRIKAALKKHNFLAAAVRINYDNRCNNRRQPNDT